MAAAREWTLWDEIIQEITEYVAERITPILNRNSRLHAEVRHERFWQRLFDRLDLEYTITDILLRFSRRLSRQRLYIELARDGPERFSQAVAEV